MRALLERLERIAARPSGARLVTADGADVEVPSSVVAVLRAAVEELAQGRSVSVVARERELTSSQAAELLGMSRPFLVRLLDEGVIPLGKVGSSMRWIATSSRGRQRRRRRIVSSR